MKLFDNADRVTSVRVMERPFRLLRLRRLWANLSLFSALVSLSAASAGPTPLASVPVEITSSAPSKVLLNQGYSGGDVKAVIESIEIVKELFVDASADGMLADGSAERPYVRIMDAASALQQALEDSEATRLRIAPGIYREDLRHLIPPKRSRTATLRATPLIIEGDAPGTVIIKGSVTHDATHDFRAPTWSAVEGEPGLYVRDWPFRAEPNAGPWMDSYGFALLPGLMQRSESLWIGGRHPRQVLTEVYEWSDPDGPRGYADRGTGKGGDATNQPGELIFSHLATASPAEALDTPWTFCVYNSPATPEALYGKIFLRLPAEMPLAEAGLIEFGLWRGEWAPLVLFQEKDNFILRNLSIQQVVTGPLGSAVAINDCKNFVLENIDISNNAAIGLIIKDAHNSQLHSVQANDNGAGGINLGNSRGMLLEDCETSFNNYRGGWAGWLGWHPAGLKAGHVGEMTFRRFTAVGNYAGALWFDVYCHDIMVEDSFLFGNVRLGLMFELTRPNGGPQTARNSIFAFNGNTGAFLSMSANSGLIGCLVANNGGLSNVEGETKHTQVLFKFRDHPQAPKSSKEWESVLLQGNTLATADPDGRLIDYLLRDTNPRTHYPRVLQVLDSDWNRYWSPRPEAAFRSPGGHFISLDAWRALQIEEGAPAGYDLLSTWVAPGFDEDPRREFTPESNSELTQRARSMDIPLPGTRIDEYWHRVESGLYEAPHLFITRQVD